MRDAVAAPTPGGIVGVKASTDLSEFAAFADALRGHRTESEQVVRHALERVGERYPGRFLDEVRDISRAIDGTLVELDRAAEELRVQNEGAPRRTCGPRGDIPPVPRPLRARSVGVRRDDPGHADPLREPGGVRALR